MVWQKQNDQMLLIGDILGNNSGSVLRETAASPDCKGGALASVNQGIAAQLDGQKVGPVVQGIEAMVDADPRLTYNETTRQFTRDGAVVTNWRASPRVANVVVYDPAKSTSSKVIVADVVTIFFLMPSKGNNAQAWGYVFRSLGIADNCAATKTCAASTLALRLVR
jgi:hypothetical protein